MKDPPINTRVRSTRMPSLTTKACVGTCKSSINYKLEEVCFRNSNIDEAKTKRAAEVNEWAKSKILNPEPTWNLSVQAKKPTIESRTMENFVGDRSRAFAYNYRAESLDPVRIQEPIDKPTKFHLSRTSVSAATTYRNKQSSDPIQEGIFRRLEEIPVNVKLAEKVEWNSMTAHSAKERDMKLVSLTNESKSNTTKNSKLLSKANYVSPSDREMLCQRTLRDQKCAGTFDPASRNSKEAVNDRSLPKHYGTARKSTRYSTSEHSGVWELNKAENRCAEILVIFVLTINTNNTESSLSHRRCDSYSEYQFYRYMWSDTGSSVYDSLGDIKKFHDPEKKIYVGPETPPERWGAMDASRTKL